MGAPRFDDLVKKGGKLSGPAPAAPRFAELVAKGGKVADAPEVQPVPDEPEDPGIWKTLAHQGVSGFFKGGADEAIGGITRATLDPDASMRWGPEGRKLATEGDIYRAGRDAERGILKKTDDAHPWLSFGAQVGGDLLSDAALKMLGVPGVGTQPYNIATGALTGLLSSDADLTPDKATPRSMLQAGGSTGLGAGLAYAIPKVANHFKGSALERFLAKKVGKAQGEIDQKAAEVFGKASLSARSELGSAAKTVHTAGRELAEKHAQGRMLPEEAAKYAAALADPSIEKLDRSIIQNSLDDLAAGPAKVDAKRAVTDELLDNGPEHLAKLQDDIGNHPFRRTIGPFLGRYAPTLAGMAAGAAGAGGLTGSILAALGGAVAGGIGGNRFKRAGPAVGSALADEADTLLGKDIASVTERAASKIADKAKDSFGQTGRAAQAFSLPGALGGAAQAASGNTSGPAAQAAKRLALSPDIRKWWFKNLSTVLEAGADKLGKFGPVLARQLQRHGPDAAMAMHEALLGEDEDYAQRVLELSPPQRSIEAVPTQGARRE